jgi:hypothetical protein
MNTVTQKTVKERSEEAEAKAKRSPLIISSHGR